MTAHRDDPLGAYVLRGEPWEAEPSHYSVCNTEVCNTEHDVECAKRYGRVQPVRATVDGMSERNGDRARFQKNRKRKLRNRERIQAFVRTLSKRSKDDVSSRTASQGMLDEGGQLRSGD